MYSFFLMNVTTVLQALLIGFDRPLYAAPRLSYCRPAAAGFYGRQHSHGALIFSFQPVPNLGSTCCFLQFESLLNDEAIFERALKRKACMTEMTCEGCLSMSATGA